MELIYTDGTYRRNHPTWHEEDSAWKAGRVPGGYGLLVPAR